MEKPQTLDDMASLRREFERFILEYDHPCIMAQSVFSDASVNLRCYDKFGSRDSARAMLPDLQNYISGYSFSKNDFYTFIAAFPSQGPMDELTFEEKLWAQLQFLHEADDALWDPQVSSDPESAHFSFSLGGHAFYIVGLHPDSSRMARRGPVPALVFNLHHQFEMLREMGSYERIRDQIRERDKQLQGSVNPMLKDFGRASEARQYSGRQTGTDWRCPFHKKSD